VAIEPVAPSVEVLSAGPCGHLQLRSGGAPEFRALAVGGYLELGNGIHADAICELLIDSGIRYRLSVHREVVFIRSLAVESRRARSSICGRAGHSLEKTGEIAAVESDVDDLPARNDTRSLGGHRLQLHCFGFNRQRFIL